MLSKQEEDRERRETGHRVFHAHCPILCNHCNIFRDKNQPFCLCFQ
jgi:hypothetical protein